MKPLPLLCACLLLTATALAKEIYVNNQLGSDESAGTADAPLRSARRAVARAKAGDTIHFKSDQPHRCENAARGRTEVIWVFSDGLSF